MKKKILLFMFVCIGIFALGSITVSAETYGDLTYKIENGEITITDCNESATEVEIPAEIDGLPVTSIGDEAFYSCCGITSITIPDSVKKIEMSSFERCSNLEEVFIGKGIQSIGYSAFGGCWNIGKLYVADLKAYLNCEWGGSAANPMAYSPALYIDGKRVSQIEIPDGVVRIPALAFYGCSGLTSVTFPDSVIEIGDSAFEKCIALTQINLPNNLTTIGHYVFSECTGLTDIKIPDSVTTIGSSMFYGCTGLSTADTGNGLKEIPYEMFRKCYDLKEVIIGNNVTIIGANSFQHCSNLKSLTIPDNVVEIGEYAFYYSGLESITIGNSVTKIGSEAFQCFSLKIVNISNMEMWCNIKFDDGVSVHWYGNTNPLYNYYAALYINGKKVEDLIIPDGITTINKVAFFNGSQFLSVSIPATVTEIERNAFSGCDNISTVYYSGTDEEWNEIYVEAGNEALTNAQRKTIYYITLIADNGNTSSVTYLPGENVKISDIEKKYMHKVTFYTDEAMTKEFNSATAINENLTLYVKLGEEITVIYGDIDDDGEVTMNDAIYLFNAAMFPEQYPIPSGQKTDYNDDGVFDMNDAIYLFNHSMFPDAFPI